MLKKFFHSVYNIYNINKIKSNCTYYYTSNSLLKGGGSHRTHQIVDMASGTNKIVGYSDVLTATKNNDTYIIDVREPDEFRQGKIPNSINIPLAEVENALKNYSDTEFKSKYGRSKPEPEAKIIFSCRSGKRASTALDKAEKLGFKNIQFYGGSWLDWEKHNSK